MSVRIPVTFEAAENATYMLYSAKRYFCNGLRKKQHHRKEVDILEKNGEWLNKYITSKAKEVYAYNIRMKKENEILASEIRTHVYQGG